MARMRAATLPHHSPRRKYASGSGSAIEGRGQRFGSSVRLYRTTRFHQLLEAIHIPPQAFFHLLAIMPAGLWVVAHLQRYFRAAAEGHLETGHAGAVRSFQS